MIIRSKNFVLKLEEILKEELPTERYNEHEKFVLKIIRDWHSNASSFAHQTSGSTGRPKKINISRDKIEISSKSTLSFIDPEGKVKSALLCLNPLHIGGAMVIYRGLIYNHDITIVDPTSFPLHEFATETFDLVSLVPLQFKKLKKEQLDLFGTILIGGASVEKQEVGSKARIYSTFGMTETVSHIALRAIENDEFTTTGDTVIACDDEGALMIKGSITDHQWLITNDLVSVTSDKSFKWIGRRDFIINSGGIKINPENIEQQLSSQIIGAEFMVGSLPDDRLGRRIVLISNGDEVELDFSGLDRYHQPKASYFNQSIYKTTSGKIDRLKTQRKFEESV